MSKALSLIIVFVLLPGLAFLYRYLKNKPGKQRMEEIFKEQALEEKESLKRWKEYVEKEEEEERQAEEAKNNLNKYINEVSKIIEDPLIDEKARDTCIEKLKEANDTLEAMETQKYIKQLEDEVRALRYREQNLKQITSNDYANPLIIQTVPSSPSYYQQRVARKAQIQARQDIRSASLKMEGYAKGMTSNDPNVRAGSAANYATQQRFLNDAEARLKSALINGK